MSAGVVDDAGRVHRPGAPGHARATTSAQTEARHRRGGRARWPPRHEVAAVGIGAAGWIANDRATVLFSPHLAWRNEPLRDALAGRIGLPLVVENDANAAAWAEYRFGAAQGERVVVCVTLGTGIGGGLVVGGDGVPRRATASPASTAT